MALRRTVRVALPVVAILLAACTVKRHPLGAVTGGADAEAPEAVHARTRKTIVLIGDVAYFVPPQCLPDPDAGAPSVRSAARSDRPNVQASSHVPAVQAASDAPAVHVESSSSARRDHAPAIQSASSKKPDAAPSVRSASSKDRDRNRDGSRRGKSSKPKSSGLSCTPLVGRYGFQVHGPVPATISVLFSGERRDGFEHGTVDLLTPR